MTASACEKTASGSRRSAVHGGAHGGQGGGTPFQWHRHAWQCEGAPGCTEHPHGQPPNVRVRVVQAGDDRWHVLRELRGRKLDHRSESAAAQQLGVVARLPRRVQLKPVVQGAVRRGVGICTVTRRRSAVRGGGQESFGCVEGAERKVYVHTVLRNARGKHTPCVVVVVDVIWNALSVAMVSTEMPAKRSRRAQLIAPRRRAAGGFPSATAGGAAAVDAAAVDAI
eukprot:7222859-Prymnesium_polylepis.1